MMVRNCLLTAALLSCAVAWAQVYERITDSPVVRDGGSSANVSWIDVDGDGDLDLFITNDETNQGNFLYLNDGAGHFTAVDDDPILETGGHNVGASWGDYDNDGDADCFVARWSNQSNKLYVNNGDGTFSRGAVPPITNSGGYSETGSWADFDADGWLDLLVTNSSGSNHHNWLYRSNGDGTFALHDEPPFNTDGDDSRSVNWFDFDGDGWLDLFVANENNDHDALYDNLGNGLFASVEGVPPTIDGVSNLTSSVGDFDNDGDFDLFVGSYSSPSRLYRNTGGNYELISNSPACTDNQQAVGSAFADYDNDGDLDLLVTNGFAANGNIYRHNYLYDNDGEGNFSRASNEPIEADSGWGFGCAFGDMDADQDLDLCIARSRNANEDNLLYHNTQAGNRGLVLKLRGTVSNRSAIGALVVLETDTLSGDRQYRIVEAQSGYCGQSQDVHFGVGDANVVQRVTVHWPSTSIESYLNLATDEAYTIVEHGGIVSIDERGLPTPTNFLVMNAYPNPFNAGVTLAAELPTRSATNVEVFNTLGQRVATLFDGTAGPGALALTWQPNALASGIYVVNVTQNSASQTQTIHFIK
ncbi:MAG: VCBS repeat-containing protein [bacterium]|nr:VCBS repeat-containing protein [bacterium]